MKNKYNYKREFIKRENIMDEEVTQEIESKKEVVIDTEPVDVIEINDIETEPEEAKLDLDGDVVQEKQEHNDVIYELRSQLKLAQIYGYSTNLKIIDTQSLGPITKYTIEYNGHILKVKAIKIGNKYNYGLE